MVAHEAVIITHTDLDGVSSAAIYLRLAGLEPDVDVIIHFTEPYKLHKVLNNLPDSKKLVITDLGPNASTIDAIAERLGRLVRDGARVEWYDHHRWQEEWITKIRSLGVKLHVDVSTCAAGVVARYAPQELGVEADEFVNRLARITCAADLWRWDEPMAGRLYRVVERYHGRRGDKWRRSLVKGFYSGSLWWPELEEALNEYLKLEFEGFNKSLRSVRIVERSSCRIVGVLKPRGPPAASIIASSLLSRYDADIAVIVRKRGRGISLRSRRVNVREVAVELGGGGHPKAAGAPLNMPLSLKLLSIFIPKLKLTYALKLVSEAVERLGGCEKLRLQLQD
jgi:oligoribonuclease NrnB/cAMP/cGMP phosphodiesterase (DHH superfamily)